MNEHRAVSATSTVGSPQDDGWYGLCSCGYFASVGPRWEGETVGENMLMKHIAVANAP